MTAAFIEQDTLTELAKTDEMEDLSMTQRLALYETAIETLGMMVAVRSEWISAERKKSNPNKSLINKWEDEQIDFFLQDERLLLHDTAKIEEIIAVYAPIIKKEFAKYS